jgi:hypothetical protein
VPHLVEKNIKEEKGRSQIGYTGKITGIDAKSDWIVANGEEG